VDFVAEKPPPSPIFNSSALASSFYLFSLPPWINNSLIKLVLQFWDLPMSISVLSRLGCFAD
jgi:hypothetical protein